MDYMLVARSKSADGFSDEPGTVYFLGVPSDEDTPKFRHKMSPRAWCDAVSEHASSGTRNTQTTGDIVFYVHGYNNSQGTVLERQRKLQRGLERNGFDGVVVSFDWPSADYVLNYLEDRHDAKKSALMLVKHGIHAFAKMQEPACKIDMHVMAHSMGAYVVREAFDDADDTADIAKKSWSISQVMLVGADVSVASLSAGNPKSSSLYRHCARLTNYHNPFDNALSVSAVKRIGVAPRAGRRGLEAPLHDKAADVHCGEYYENRFRDESFNHGHTWYFDDTHFLQEVYLTICGEIDRVSIPTRTKTRDGELALRV